MRRNSSVGVTQRAVSSIVVGGLAAVLSGHGASAAIVWTVPGGGFTPSGSQDITGDGNAMLSWQRASSTSGTLTLFNGSYYASQPFTSLPAQYITSGVLSGTGLTISGEIAAGGIVGSATPFSPSVTALSMTQTGSVQNNTGYDGYTYSCDNGKRTCSGSSAYNYQTVSYANTSYGGELLGAPNSSGYVGLNLNVGGETHYGWAKFGVDSTGGNDLLLQLQGFAYETTAGRSITAGQTVRAADEVGPAAVPEPATLLLLAGGIAGLAAFRRRPETAAA